MVRKGKKAVVLQVPVMFGVFHQVVAGYQREKEREREPSTKTETHLQAHVERERERGTLTLAEAVSQPDGGE